MFKEQMKIRDEKMNAIMDDLDDGMAMDTIINMFEYLLRDIGDNYYDGLLASSFQSFKYWVKECQDGDVKRGF